MTYAAKVTESIFNAVKTLIKGGATIKEAADYMGLSVGTINVIKASETFAEYKQNMYLRSRAYKGEKKAKPETAEPQQVVEHRQTVTVQASHFMLEEQRKTNELLTLISNKLGFIVDELTK